jgi:hypothetical protein
MPRLIVLLAAIVIGAAAPARAWCEASCLAPKPDVRSHCPSHQPASDATTISAIAIDECPALDSARPATPARLDAAAVVIAVHTPTKTTAAIHLPTSALPHHASTVFERATPLRI